MAHFHAVTKEQPAQVTALHLPDNVSCTLLRPGNISIQPMPMPILQPDGVLVKVMVTGICGSDMHVYKSGGLGGKNNMKAPVVMGHESVGTVIAVGDLVRTHKIGDRVAVEPGLPCRRCPNCKTGRSNLCYDSKYCGAPGSVGSLSRWYAVPADMAPHVADHIPWDTAGSIQPLAIGVHISKRAQWQANSTLAIVGCGPIGLLTAAVAHAHSVRKIIGFDINPARVEFAKKYTSPINGRPIFAEVYHIPSLSDTPRRAKNQNADEHVADEIVRDMDETTQNDSHHKTHGNLGDKKWEHAELLAAEILEHSGLLSERGVDKVVEAAGAEDAILLGVAIAKPGATLVQVGFNHTMTSLWPGVAVTNKEIDVRGMTRYTPPCFPEAIDLLSRGLVDLSQLITADFPLSRAQEALDAVASGKHIKVIIRNQEV